MTFTNTFVLMFEFQQCISLSPFWLKFQIKKKKCLGCVSSLLLNLLLCNKLPQNLAASSNKDIVISVSLGQESRHGLAVDLCFKICHKAATEVFGRGYNLIWKLNWGKTRFSGHSYGCWKDSVPCGLLEWGSTAWFSVDWGLPHFPALWASP